MRPCGLGISRLMVWGLCRLGGFLEGFRGFVFGGGLELDRLLCMLRFLLSSSCL